MASVTNISVYQFAALTELQLLRERLFALCQDAHLRGTILLSHEGVNLFVAGSAESIDALLAAVRAVPGLERLSPKFSLSDEQPFTRMLVKIKKEIIAFGIEGIDPANNPTPKLSPRELKAWLDEGRPITLLDTRNNFEVKLGSFRNARAIGIEHFREFPIAVQKLPDDLKRQPIVMFCTGGIRCEKAGPFMQREGFEQVYQLDGGILKYFEECGDAHYTGDCFVFDKRVGLEPNLEPSTKLQCFACLMPLEEAESHDPRFFVGVSCPYCFRTSEQRRDDERYAHQAAIRTATYPLPGSIPCHNHRPLNVPASLANQTVLDLLCELLRQTSREEWQSECERGMILDAGFQPVMATRIVKAGERYYQCRPLPLEPDVNADICIVYEDDAILIFDKPAPLPLSPNGLFNRNTLQEIVRTAYAPQKPRPAHRLHANATGLILFTRTSTFAKQFALDEVEYLTRVIGHPEDSTEFEVLQRFPDGTSLLKLTSDFQLEALGWPICTTENRLYLHAHRIVFRHPLGHERVSFIAEPPGYFSRIPIKDNR